MEIHFQTMVSIIPVVLVDIQLSNNRNIVIIARKGLYFSLRRARLNIMLFGCVRSTWYIWQKKTFKFDIQQLEQCRNCIHFLRRDRKLVHMRFVQGNQITVTCCTGFYVCTVLWTLNVRCSGTLRISAIWINSLFQIFSD